MFNNKFNDTFNQKILFNEDEIKDRVNECAKWLNKYFVGKKKKNNIVVVPILDGSICFSSYLLLRLNFKFTLDFYTIKSYREKISFPKIIKDIDTDVKNKYVVIIENVIESGRTLEYIIEDLKNKDVLDIIVVSLINKPEKRKVNIQPHYTCFVTNEDQLIGWGLDYENKFRNLPYIASISKK
ncbi:phosphoribosyltransferase [Malacoplasma iowae]|uniref:Hypoxanthine-guanine phosphoribosyltransferase n=2 Tax=Malacoplasma iowae TaxID=2116 RepID=A0A084U362_MALIO|nr:phosphoribosyltransferase family protein [Malacoplasma iowae]VEU61603.1 hypoxanthine-guanine phosphoribosyltransferases [Mycoplasmopsis fermentans]EGZ31460.1 hypoxanthine-guanine phosphoribosyltransferase [Malacoplasma iowae 695]KFB07398.1 hypoxanthine-guanine phosphoribosyltransferase [Malacoplasma iowae DK-CPA]QHG89306.1 phosphoribosyltransferase family protein [Malacoplasma iowae 695]WPL35997.1 phosphoribosyltransferase family protein [Malacoplasma iowae]